MGAGGRHHDGRGERPRSVSQPLQLELLGRDAPPARLDPALELVGPVVRLVPLEQRHAETLDHWVERDPESFELILSSPLHRGGGSAFIAWLHEQRDRGVSVPFAVESSDDGRMLGYTRYLHFDPPKRTVTVGGTWYVPDVRGTAVNPASKLLLLEHAFERAHINRVEIHTDTRNERSRRAIENIGAQLEGIQRADRIDNAGNVGDSVVYALIRSEWHEVKGKLEQRVAAKLAS
jgi:N-acetyltransferase